MISARLRFDCGASVGAGCLCIWSLLLCWGDGGINITDLPEPAPPPVSVRVFVGENPVQVIILLYFELCSLAVSESTVSGAGDSTS